jgi:hypothetical protein
VTPKKVLEHIQQALDDIRQKGLLRTYKKNVRIRRSAPKHSPTKTQFMSLSQAVDDIYIIFPLPCQVTMITTIRSSSTTGLTSLPMLRMGFLTQTQ